ncbi:MAG TPA: MFS transporter [Devosia sp.]|nr:MFS transporter [Devosia sp.]
MSLPLFALFFAAFGIGTNEFVIAGLLPDVAGDLGITIPDAGYLITLYALGIAIGGPLTAMALGRFERKRTLLVLVAVFVIGQAACALAPNFAALAAVRVVLAFAHGAFFGVAAIVAIGLVPPERRGSAVALLLAGITVANILGVPAGTAIGNTFGWRATFWAVGILVLLGWLGLAIAVPTMRQAASAPRPRLAQEVGVLGRQAVFMSFAVIVVAMIGQFSLFTYIAPLLTEVTGVAEGAVPWLLLLFGLGSTVGVLLGGRLADWRLMPTLLAVLLLNAAIYAVIALVIRAPIPMGIAIFVWGGLAFGFGAPAQARILRATVDAPNLASPLVPAAFNVGIALGATIGSLVLDHGFGYTSLPWIGVVVSLLALVIALASWSMERRGGQPALP